MFAILYRSQIPLFRLLFLLIGCFYVEGVAAQTTCPVNLGFELGGLQNWESYRGTVRSNGFENIITVAPSTPINGVHTIIKSSKQQDNYAPIELSAPDGSDYIVKLGNSGAGSQAERISYTFTVPQNQTDFVVTYQYAVVLEDPNHPASQQPRFTAKVFDITDNNYISCGSFDYVATANLPGFKNLGGLIYKDWTPASINLYGYQGHQLRLEFTTADCTQSGHFGYAYIDVNNACSSLITGNKYCPQSANFTLTGPAGFDKYNWYNADRSKLLGTGLNLTLPTANNNNKTILLDLVPYAGFGCNYTTSVVTEALAAVALTLKDPAQVCVPSTVDITTASVITDKVSGLVYTYWKDANGTTPLTNPSVVGTSGTYYVKATATSGCFVIKPVKVVVNALPVVKINNPATVCISSLVDITTTAITAGSSANLTYSYWLDANAQQQLLTPTAIKNAGTYYIQATNANGCSIIKPVMVSFYALPILKITNPQAVCAGTPVNLQLASITAGSDVNLTFSYWMDAQATLPLSNPSAVNTAGRYFIKAVNTNSCEIVKPVQVTSNPLPALVITNPQPVCEPQTIDITLARITQGSTNIATLTYWRDADATLPLANPATLDKGGIFYIKAISSLGCEVTKPITVVIYTQPDLKITNPATVCLSTPVDLSANNITSGSSAGLTFTYWLDAGAVQQVANPAAVTRAGTYFIKATNANNCVTIKPVRVTYFDLPVLVTTDPQAVCFPLTVDITKANVTNGSDNGLTFSYWSDAGASIPLQSPAAIGQSGTCYIKAINANGCEQIASVNVTINPLPVLLINQPAGVCFPETVDLTAAAITSGSTNINTLTYWSDPNATLAVARPGAVTSGRYYIKATSIFGCEVVQPVNVVVHDLPVLVVTNPAKVYIPAKVDITKPLVTTGSTANIILTYWHDEYATLPLNQPKEIITSGVYYIKATNQYGCYVIKPVSVTVATVPNIIAPTAFTPTKTENNRLYPFLIGIKSLVSFKVYNHWGALVFETTNAAPEAGWDGTFKGEIQFFDTVTWYAQGYDYVGNLVKRSGNTVLLK